MLKDVVFKQKLRGDYQGSEEEILDEALNSIVDEKLQLQEGKKREN